MLQRVGSGADVGLVALFAAGAAKAGNTGAAASPQVEAGLEPLAPAADRPVPDYEQPALSGEAPAEFALVDEFAEPDQMSAVETVAEAIASAKS